jgi:hypothetical protein
MLAVYFGLSPELARKKNIRQAFCAHSCLQAATVQSQKDDVPRFKTDKNPTFRRKVQRNVAKSWKTAMHAAQSGHAF